MKVLTREKIVSNLKEISKQKDSLNHQRTQIPKSLTNTRIYKRTLQ